MKRSEYSVIPRKDRSSSLLVGGTAWWRACINFSWIWLARSGLIPAFVNVNPTNCFSGTSDRHFSQLHVTLLSSSLFKTDYYVWSCSELTSIYLMWDSSLQESLSFYFVGCLEQTSHRNLIACIATARLIRRMWWPFSSLSLTQTDNTPPVSPILRTWRRCEIYW